MALLDENQIQQLLIAAQASKPGFQALYQLALSTGMRQVELLGLKWKGLDWDKRRIHVCRQLKTVSNKALVPRPPKTKLSIRTVMIGEKVKQTLKIHNKHQL
jgi:integrase